jgi:hypothetical protein
MAWDNDKKTEITLFFKIWIGCLVVNDDKVFICCSALLVPTTWEVTNDKQFLFAHTFSQDLDWLSLDNNDQVFSWWYDIKEVVALLVLTACEVNND